MSDIFSSIKTNPLFVSVVGWVLAQTVKVGIGVIKERKFDFRWFVGTGGMPSTHAAGVSALAVAIGLSAGFNSPVFAVAGIFAFVVLFDAQTVRRAFGKQAELLNKIVDDIHSRKHFQEERGDGDRVTDCPFSTQGEDASKKRVPIEADIFPKRL